MKFRATYVIALAISVALSFSPDVAQSAGKVAAGVVCKTLNLKVIASGKKFTCTKSGKKLVWNKGVTVKTPTPTPTNTVKSFTKSDIAIHNKESDCWTYVDLKVYDLTAWLPQHPGGGAIVLGMCGTDGAVIFRDHHHAEQDSAISLYYLGDLK